MFAVFKITHGTNCRNLICSYFERLCGAVETLANINFPVKNGFFACVEMAIILRHK